MSVKLHWQIEEPVPPPTANELLGTVEVTDGTSTIRREHAYIDSWLQALLEGVFELRDGYSIVRVTFPEEPEGAFLRVRQGAVVIEQGGQEVLAGSMQEFASAVSIAARDLLQYAKLLKGESSTIRALEEALRRVEQAP